MPVTPNMKVAEVLKRHPQLLDVLVAQSPHFARLKNPVLRRLQGRLVTIVQAAAIAGLEPAVLIARLNAALGEDGPAVAAARLNGAATIDAPPWVAVAQVAKRLDVRDDQRDGSDPFAKIVAAVAEVPEGQAMVLRNTFEPFPLYVVLGKRGFEPWARQLASDDWEIYFFNAGRAAASNGATTSGATTAPATETDLYSDEGQPAATITIDVRDLQPPAPMIRILEALDRLQQGDTLLVHHVRRPVYLYPRLEELGYAHETRELGPDRVDIVIRR